MKDERYGNRDLSYSSWHRVGSIQRYVGLEKAQSLTMFDVDAMPWVETAEYGKTPVAFIETAIDVGQTDKKTYIGVVGKLSDMPAYVVLYKLAESSNPASPQWSDIESFRVKELYPNKDPSWKWMSAGEYANWLFSSRSKWIERMSKRLSSP